MRRAAIAYSAEEMAWLDANKSMIISDYHRAFCDVFDRFDVSSAHLHMLRKRKGWKVGRAPGRFTGRHLKFSNVEIEWLRENCTMTISDYHRAFCARFDRYDISAQNLNGLRKRKGWRTGRTGHFDKGHVPDNKGKPCPPGTGGRHPNARQTQFRKGEAAHNYRGPGHEWLDAEQGYIVMIVEGKNPWNGHNTRPVHKHRYLWEQANGPVPEGCVLKCLDGDKTNCNPANWQSIPRGVLPVLSGRFGLGYENADGDLKPVIMTLARLKHAAHSAKKARQQKAAGGTSE